MMNKNTHGGHRTPGPGKTLGRNPKLKNAVRVGPVWMEKSDRDWLKEQAPTIAEAIRAIVKKARDKNIK